MAKRNDAECNHYYYFNMCSYLAQREPSLSPRIRALETLLLELWAFSPINDEKKASVVVVKHQQSTYAADIWNMYLRSTFQQGPSTESFNRLMSVEENVKCRIRRISSAIWDTTTNMVRSYLTEHTQFHVVDFKRRLITPYTHVWCRDRLPLRAINTQVSQIPIKSVAHKLFIWQIEFCMFARAVWCFKVWTNKWNYGYLHPRKRHRWCDYFVPHELISMFFDKLNWARLHYTNLDETCVLICCHRHRQPLGKSSTPPHLHAVDGRSSCVESRIHLWCRNRWRMPAYLSAAQKHDANCEMLNSINLFTANILKPKFLYRQFHAVKASSITMCECKASRSLFNSAMRANDNVRFRFRSGHSSASAESIFSREKFLV